MGITGLLPFLEKATKPCHISEFRGATVVVDTYCWLHRGATTCAIQLVQGQETNLYVNFCIRYIKMLQSYDIRPILVFDGRNLPAKAGTESKRREARGKAKQKAAELLSQGKTDEAKSYLKASLNITPEMACVLIKECHKLKVDCIVAPYESDAQLAFFSLQGVAELVITEDSDLILFGCPKVFYKLDMQGCGYLVDAEKICMAMNIRPDKYTFDKFRHMCIMSGCDYVDSLQGIGLKKALKFMVLTDESDPDKFLDKIPRYLKMSKLEVTEEYKKNFMLADATFKHQIVFDPFKKKLVPLIDPQITGTNPKYCENAGEIYDQDKAYQVALGNLHPSSFKRLNNWDPKTSELTNKSIWYNGTYERSVSRKEQKQKAVFKTYFNKTKLEAVSEADDLQLKTEEDDRIKQEIEFYSKPIPKQEIVKIEKNPKKIDNEDENISPILKKNPFVKKISKFQRTEIQPKIIVKSRYFSPPSMEMKETSIVKDNEDVVNPIKSDETTETLGNVEDRETIMIIENGIQQRDNKLSESKVVEAIIDLDTEFESPLLEKFSSVKNADSAKRKLCLGPCRSLGLKKMKIQGQQTISSFFEKFKKPS